MATFNYNKKPETFYVWRRSDGYVNATTFKPQDGPTMSFEVLNVFHEWTADVVAYIEQQRAKQK